MRDKVPVYILTVISLLTLAFTSCTPRVAQYSEYANPNYDLRGTITPDDPEVRSVLRSILADENDMRTDFRRIQDWVASNIIYDSVVTDKWQKPAETLKTRRGDCKDYSTLLCTLLRSYGIPADKVYVAIGASYNNRLHAFVIEKYITGEWQVVEPQIGGFVKAALGAIATAEKYAIKYLFNDLEYSGQPNWIYSRINGGNNLKIASPDFEKIIPLPVVNSFTCVPQRISIGQKAVLRWQVSGADYVSITEGIGQVEPSGSAVVYPSADTEYRIVARNKSGIINSSVMVRVLAVPAGQYIQQETAIESTHREMVIGFVGWFSNDRIVSSARVGQQVSGRINIRGGRPGQCFMRIWRSVINRKDDIVAIQAFSYDGVETDQQISFAPSYAVGESGTIGYYLDLSLDSEQIWLMPDGYPPRLMAIPRPSTGTLMVNFAGWWNGMGFVQSVKKAQLVKGIIALTGGTADIYTLRVRRDIEGSNDEIMQELSFTYDGTSCVQEISFTPDLSTGESGTRGYYLEMYRGNIYVWTLSSNYPPRLKVEQ